jgi:restriction system protein
MLPELSLESLKSSANAFSKQLHTRPITDLYGATDGKALGTYIEQNFRAYLSERYTFLLGNSASGIDFPSINVDLKATFASQPQSSCPFRDASQKVYGLGYHLLVFVYEKQDDPSLRAARLHIKNVIFVHKDRTGDWQSTKGILDIIQRDGNKDDIVAFLEDRNFPLDEIGRETLANRLLLQPPMLGYLTISNALQWRLQYSRVINVAGQGTVEGVEILYV